MIIEFFGEPGSGKTTLLKRLLARLPGEAVFVRVESRFEVLRYVISYAFREPSQFLFWLSTTSSNAGGLLRYKLGLVLRSMATLEKARRSKKRYTFIDEGIAQRILSLFDRLLSRDEATGLVARLPKTDTFVVCSGGDFSRFTKEPDRFNSPRVRQGKERFDAWSRAVITNAALIGGLLPHVVQANGASDEEIIDRL